MALDKTKFSEIYQKSRTDKARHERLWDISRLFLGNHQFVEHDRTTDTLRVFEDENDIYATNLIKPLYRFVLSGLAVEYPSISVLPSSPSTEDILKAQASLEASRYYWSEQELKQKLLELAEWLTSIGNGGLHTFYDKDEDKVRTEVVSGYDLFFVKGVSNQSQSKVQIRRSIHDREMLKETFSEHAEAIEKAPAVMSTSSLLDGGVPEDHIEVFETYWSDGVHEIRLENEVLDEDEWNLNTMPLVHVVYMRVPGVLWGDGLVGDLLDLQTLYNQKNMQIVEAIRNTADPFTLVPITSDVDASQFTNEGSRVVYYNAAGGAPSHLSGITLPPETFADLQRVKSDMMDVAGIHSTSLGKTAKGVNSAKHVDSLKQADSSQLQPTQQGLEWAFGMVAKTSLILMQDHYNQPRWMRMMDSTGAFIHKELKSTDLSEDPEVFIEAGSLFRNETQDRRQKVLELHAAGLLSPDQAMAEMAFGTSNKFVLDKIMAMSHAQELLTAVKQGFDILVYPTDDLQSIDRVFKEFMRTPEYYQLPIDFQQHMSDIYVSVVQGTIVQQPVPQPGEVKVNKDLLKAAGNPPVKGPGTAQVPGFPQRPIPGGADEVATESSFPEVG